MLCQLLITLFCMISLQSMIFAAFSIGTTYLLPLLYLLFLKFLTSEWVQCSSPGLFFLCESRCSYFLVPTSFSKTFAYDILDAISVLLRQSFGIKEPKCLNWSLCLSLFSLIKMLFCEQSLFQLMTNPSVFLLLNSNHFYLLSSSTICNYFCKSSLLSAINSLSWAYLNCKVYASY